ncbi:NAD(P)/FAD-dependent oxidoreductase [Riemerella anatipestifer]|uniref:Ferredoxin--NADP reductase n=1 Tax=Riemerella anatipestifer (strain ATCC 11845 / DSM 15868 / JCM 9532 / NCTC 11014) TaxID=693978 RepID=E4TBR4_RIEAD|nr:NAD(P)/FAD-dependent oxidoreductase [Riemerella anatipestifer]ADQ81961.1 FAD-dependent pyridine nucleotide-disulfide oxidoreductase [Riemerella anatipestifer ATCC 11845 = DSM 15868]AFD55966.1 faD-dependent pyridine nucleotide-disulfide oxidoreductase [Riemerella anatipestifer ATCC 11845 = DSM 15868]MCO7315738.1 NAD(P)/FAD-dependent oxidoreductase [Riemerella anatipestifer]MCO7324093.1 NAD(P)/FAD-dependent oxidoreductase [Riemerella anatipestifer]MCQ4062643.1 NAD(P)/FAD-dependent oxidoreduct
MITTDLLIIGAGPTGLFAVFEAGLLKLKCHIIDALPQPGGQLAELYPKKPIFDIPGYPSVNAGELVDNLMEQIKQFQPGFTLAETAVSLEKIDDEWFEVITNKGTVHRAKAVAIAGGLGTFEPRKPLLENLEKYEENGVEYFVKDPEVFRDKKIVIAGGGDSALDWSIFLSNVAKEVTLVHRRNEFRGALDSVEKVQELKNQGKINLVTPAEVVELKGSNTLESIVIEREGEKTEIETDYFIPLFGLTPKLGPIADWGLEIEKNSIKVNNALDYQTNREGIYAIGDINTYPGKLKLILCGFHEATLMCQSVYNRLNPGKKYVLKYTTVSGVDGFDGSRKEAEKAVVKKID